MDIELPLTLNPQPQSGNGYPTASSIPTETLVRYPNSWGLLLTLLKGLLLTLLKGLLLTLLKDLLLTLLKGLLLTLSKASVGSRLKLSEYNQSTALAGVVLILPFDTCPHPAFWHASRLIPHLFGRLCRLTIAPVGGVETLLDILHRHARPAPVALQESATCKGDALRLRVK